MGQNNPFPSATTLHAAHQKLLDHRRENGDSKDFLAEVETFVNRGIVTGKILDTRNDRWQAQNLIDYWVNFLRLSHLKIPSAALHEYDPSLAPHLDAAFCPYLGLDSFSTNKHPFFFGRDQIVEQMVELLKLNRFLAIVGPSGSGKSSAVLAGLIPKLQAGALRGSKTWRYYLPMVPGSNPQANLARIMQAPNAANRIVWTQTTAERLQSDPNYLNKLVDQSGTDPVVLVIDQFEEIFTICLDDGKRRAFISSLLHLIQNQKARHTVVLTMRTDLESNLVQIPALQSIYEQSQVRLTAMKANELREAIVKPAELIGLKFEDDLVEQLIWDILGKPTALPLLQFTLLKLWENREHNRITWEAYRRLGGGSQTLSNSADAFYDSLTPEDQFIVRQILLAIVQPSIEQEITYNRVLRTSLYWPGIPRERIDQMLNQLIENRLVRLIAGNTYEDDQVGIAHESLVSIWPRLVGWLEEDRVAQRRRLRLTTSADQWVASNHESSVLLRGLLLEEALLYDDLSETENAFVKASVEAANRERLEREAAQQRELEQVRALAEAEKRRAEESAHFAQRVSRFSVALAVVFVIAVIAALWAARNGNVARQNEATAIANQAVADQLRVTAEFSAATAVAAQSAALADANLRATAETEAREQRDTAEQNAIEANNARATAVASAAEAEEARTISEANAREAEENAQQAETNAREAEAQSRLASARELAAASIFQLNSKPQLSLLLALEAVNKTLSVGQNAPAEAEDALYRALQASQLLLTLSGHTDWVSDVTFSPDGTRLATASLDTTVKLWDAASGQELLTLADHSRVVNSIAFSPDGNRLATAGDDGFIIIWDALTGDRLAVFNGDNGTIQALAFSPDNLHLAAANEDATVRIWNTLTRKSLYRLFGHEGSLTDVTFSQDGKYFASAGEDGRAIVWDLETGSPIYNLNPNPLNDPGKMNGLVFSPDNQRLVTAYDDGTARVWDYIKGELLFTLSGHASFVFDVAFSPDGTRLATASGDGTARIWQADSGQAIYTLSGHSGGINAITFSPDGERLATASQDGTVKIWNAEPGIDVLILSGHMGPVLNVAFSFDGDLTATASTDTTAKVWNATTGTVINTFADHNAAVNDVAFNPDGTHIATASDDFNARIWDITTGRVQLPLMVHQGPVKKVAFNPQGDLLATASNDGFARIWDVDTSQFLSRFEHSSAVNTVNFSPDGTRLATATANGIAYLWDLDSGDLLLTLLGHEGPINDIAFNFDGSQLATASGDGTAIIWDLTTGDVLRTFTGHTGPVLSVAFSPDGTRLATGSVDKTAKWWNTATGRALRTLLHTSTVNSVEFSPDGLRLATASFDRTAQIHELSASQQLFDRGMERITRALTAAECEQYLRGEPCLSKP